MRRGAGTRARINLQKRHQLKVVFYLKLTRNYISVLFFFAGSLLFDSVDPRDLIPKHFHFKIFVLGHLLIYFSAMEIYLKENYSSCICT